MTAAHRRHDMTDLVWERLEPLLMRCLGKRGRPARNNRLFLDAEFWMLRTGAPWRDLPPDYGDWNNTHHRFCRWRDRGIWKELLDVVIDDPDYESVDGGCSLCQGSSPRHWGPGRKPGDRSHKRGLNSKVHLAVDSHGMPVRISLTSGTVADCTELAELIEGIEAQFLLADRAYDTDAILALAQEMEPVIPPGRTAR